MLSASIDECYFVFHTQLNPLPSDLNQLQRFYCQVLQDTFPSIKCAFAYGSAVFQQHGLQIVS